MTRTLRAAILSSVRNRKELIRSPSLTHFSDASPPSTARIAVLWKGMMCDVVLLHHIMPLHRKKERRFPVELSNTRGQAMAPSKSLPQLMRRHPLFFYFLIAYAI